MTHLRDKAQVVLLAGLASGLLDALYFSGRALLEGRNPLQVLQAIAAFWLGRPSYEMGGASMALGFFTHFGLATLMAAGFAFGAARLAVFRGSLALAGPLYGFLLYAVMYWIVMPLRWPGAYPRFDGTGSVADIVLHLAFGTLIVWVLRQRKAV